MKRPKQLKRKRQKNVSTNEMGDVVGRVYVDSCSEKYRSFTRACPSLGRHRSVYSNYTRKREHRYKKRQTLDDIQTRKMKALKGVKKGVAAVEE